MPSDDTIAVRFEQERSRLRAVATGILGSVHEAEDAVQETWFRLDRSDPAQIQNLSAWLTVVVSRIALDFVRTRANRQEVPIEAPASTGMSAQDSAEASVILEESVTEALSHAIDRLSPLESAAFILHDLFLVPFDEISTILKRSPDATRKLASRARLKVSIPRDAPLSGTANRRHVVDAFLEAAQDGNLDRLIAVLAPNVLLRADATTVQYGAHPETVGPGSVADQFLGRAQAARIAWIDGVLGAAWIERGAVKIAFDFTIADGIIQAISLHGDPEYLAAVDFEIEPPRKHRHVDSA